MWAIILLAATVLAGSNAAVVPVDSSSVSVKQSGQDYAYSIHENHGFAIDTVPVVQPHHVPVVGVRSQQVVPANSVVTSVVTSHASPKTAVRQQPHQQQQIHLKAAVAPLPAVHQEIGAYAVPVALDYVPQGYQYAITYPHGIVPYPYSAAAFVAAV